MRAWAWASGIAFLCCAAWAMPARAPAAAVPVRLDPAEVRRTVEPALCLVTAENSWGVPVAMATGFLLGEGRFAVTDLGAVAQPGVARATLTFAGGSTSVATEFGMADPALGLVALHVPRGRSTSPGLPLAPRLPALDGLGAVAAAGWRWGTEIEVVTGRVWRGPAIRDVAVRTRIETPVGVDAFLRMDGGRIDGASGSPVVDADGTVLAVMLAVAAPSIDVALAMPASSLRRSLLDSEPRLRPLADLPEPLWPVHLLRLPGEPPKPAPFAAMRGVIKASAVCTRCKGKGKIRVEEGGGTRTHKEDVICPACRGEGAALESGLYDVLSAWAEQGTRAVWTPGPPDRTFATARSAGIEIVRWLALVGRTFREAASQAVTEPLARGSAASPRGVVMYAQVRNVEDGPDGPYVVLQPQDARMLVAVRADDLAGRDGKGPAGAGRPPAEKSWIVLAGAVLGPVSAPRAQGVFVLPFEWASAPPPMPLEPLKKK